MKKLIPFIILSFLLVACSVNTPPVAKPTGQAPASTSVSGGYPAPVATIGPGYPAPPTSTDAPDPTATINPQLAQVKGIFTLEKRPTTTFLLYLAPIVKDSKGQEIVVDFNRNKAYPAIPDEKGNFTFVNVPPGRYGLVYDAVLFSYLMTVPGKAESLIITVEGNKTVDLGELKYEAPPNN